MHESAARVQQQHNRAITVSMAPPGFCGPKKLSPLTCAQQHTDAAVRVARQQSMPDQSLERPNQLLPVVTALTYFHENPRHAAMQP